MKLKQRISNSAKGPLHNKQEIYNRSSLKCHFRNFLKWKIEKMLLLFFSPSFPLLHSALKMLTKHNFPVTRFKQFSTISIKSFHVAVLLYLSEINYSTVGQDAEYSGGAGPGQANKQPHSSLFKEITVVNLALAHLFALRGCFT